MILNYCLLMPIFSYWAFRFFYASVAFDHLAWWRQILCMGMAFLCVIFSFWAKFEGDRARFNLRKLRRRLARPSVHGAELLRK